jgi:RNase P subunit RPR2
MTTTYEEYRDSCDCCGEFLGPEHTRASAKARKESATEVAECPECGHILEAGATSCPTCSGGDYWES